MAEDAAVQTKKVRFIRNWQDPRSRITRYNGDEVTMIASAADRATRSGAAVEVEQETLEDMTVEQLKTEAEKLGVDLTGKKGSKKEIIDAIKEGADNE